MDDENNNKFDLSNLIDIVKFFLKKYPAKTMSVLVTSFHVIGTIFLVLLILIAIVAVPASLSEGFSEFIHDAGSSISAWVTPWGEKVGNFFSGYGFYNDQQAASVQEEKYYKKLNQVAKKYKDKYNVDIDTTMITATLFTGRMDDLESEDGNSEDDFKGDIYVNQSKFYKQARNHIETLAKYQLVENVTINGCSSEEATSSYSSDDKNAIAKFWDSLTGNSWSTQLTAYNQKENETTYTNNAGTTVTISCDFEDLTDKLTTAYKNDKKKVDDAKDDYDTCMSCESSCDMWDESSNQYQECISSCSSCLSEWEEYNRLNGLLKKDWYEEPNNYFSTDGELLCETENGIYGSLSFYDDATKYRNYNLNKVFTSNDALKIKKMGITSIRSYINSTSSWSCTDGKCQNTSCSRKPSIIYEYTIDVKREGVYYWKLVSDMKNTKEIDINGSFIKNYYFKDSDVTENDILERVDEIFGIYEAVAEQRLQLDSEMIANGSSTIRITADEIGDFPTFLGANGEFRDMSYQGVSADAYIGTSAPGVAMVLSQPNGKLFWQDKNIFSYGQCTWYAQGRALKALVDAGMTIDDAVKSLSAFTGNGGQWFSQNSSSCAKGGPCFSTGTVPKAGALVSMNKVGNPYGHVAYIEKIFYDENGNATEMLISEGGNSLSGFYYHRAPISYFATRYATVGYIYLLENL